jgi:hypothetical protein
MITSRNSFLARLVSRLPLWLPVYIEAVRVGTAIDSHVRIGWRF